MDYEKDLEIDPSYLDICCVDQPGLVIKYARIAADADLAMDNAKEKLELVKAELDNEIRSNPKEFDIEKITETVVANTIITQDRYKRAMEAFLLAKYEAKIVGGATRAVDHRKSMLENLVRLHGQQYFAGPNIPHDLTKEWQKKQEQKSIDTNIGRKLKRKEQ